MIIKKFNFLIILILLTIATAAIYFNYKNLIAVTKSNQVDSVSTSPNIRLGMQIVPLAERQKDPNILKPQEKKFLPRGVGIKNISKCPNGQAQGDAHQLESEIKGFQLIQSETGNFRFGKFIKKIPIDCSVVGKNCSAHRHGETTFSTQTQLLLEEINCEDSYKQKKIQVISLETVCLDGLEYLTGETNKAQVEIVPPECPKPKKVLATELKKSHSKRESAAKNEQ